MATPPPPPPTSSPRQADEAILTVPSATEAPPSTPSAQTARHSFEAKSQGPFIDTSFLASQSNHKSSHSASSQLERPGMGNRKSSGTIIIPRDSPTVEVSDEHYAEDDARAMSPRRGSDEIDKMSDEAREALESQAKNLQANLLEIVDRVEAVKTEHEKLEGGNKFLQSYIGELMQTSNLTAAGPAKPKSRGRSSKPK